MANAPIELQGMQIGGVSPVGADGTISIGPAFQPQVARRRTKADSPMSSPLHLEERPDGRGQRAL
eukprot:3862404-Pyramimonas_sp.AAC.1